MDLEKRLEQVLDRSQYGVGDAKSWDTLLREIDRGECVITWSDGKPIREVELICIQVQGDARSQFSDRKLFEAYQEFRDGRRRERNLWGVSEKMLPGEVPALAARRALCEELGFCDRELEDIVFVFHPTIDQAEKESPSYPGLWSRFTRHRAIAYLPQHLCHEQYVEHQVDKTTVFVWR
jgi:hypothetical protein